MAAASLIAEDSEDPVWLPRDPKSQISTNQLPGHSNDNRLHNGGRVYTTTPLPQYGTYNPTQGYSDIPPSSFRPDGQGTWPGPRSRPSPGSRSHLATSPSDRTSSGLSVPPRGASLQTISEHDRLTLGDMDAGDPCVARCLATGDHPPSYSQSQTPSMTNGMSTTVPQSMVQHNLNNSHRPTLPRRPRPPKMKVERENLEVRCCRITVLLVILKIALGATITALGFYMERLTSSMAMRDCPYWAGIPVLIAGVLGVYYCATDFAVYSGSSRAFVIKLLCSIFSTASVFMCMVAAIFPGIHGHRIRLYTDCQLNATELACLCRQHWGEYMREYRYDNIEDCVTVRTSIKDYLILQCALNAIASGVCLWFITLLWKKRYEDFHSGLRFYTYSASVPPHPWSDPANPPYFRDSGRQSPLTVGKVTQRPGDLSTFSSQPNTLSRTQPNTLSRTLPRSQTIYTTQHTDTDPSTQPNTQPSSEPATQPTVHVNTRPITPPNRHLTLQHSNHGNIPGSADDVGPDTLLPGEV